jgi:hypothetical protein
VTLHLPSTQDDYIPVDCGDQSIFGFWCTTRLPNSRKYYLFKDQTDKQEFLVENNVSPKELNWHAQQQNRLDIALTFNPDTQMAFPEFVCPIVVLSQEQMPNNYKGFLIGLAGVLDSMKFSLDRSIIFKIKKVYVGKETIKRGKKPKKTYRARSCNCCTSHTKKKPKRKSNFG